MSRDKDFNLILSSLMESAKLADESSIVCLGDSLEIIRNIPDQSVSMILTDPPYHSTKKSNIHGDKSFKDDATYISWLSSFMKEWRRVLKPNGSIYCFCSSEMSAKIEVELEKEFNILAHIVWSKPNEPGFDGWKQKMKKESLRQWYAHSERLLFAEPAYSGNMHRSYFGTILRDLRRQAGLSGHQLTEQTGAYGKVNHGGAVSNWETGRNIPSREQFKKIKEVIMSTGKVANFPDYEDAIRPFSVDSSVQFTDVWDFPSVRPYSNKHPAEKPLSMLEHIISTSTFEGDIILDCFAGSGSTALAARRLSRRSVSIEIEQRWFNQIVSKLSSLSLFNFQIGSGKSIKASSIDNSEAVI